MILLVDSEGPDQTARMRRLIWAFDVRMCPRTFSLCVAQFYFFFCSEHNNNIYTQLYIICTARGNMTFFFFLIKDTDILISSRNFLWFLIKNDNSVSTHSLFLRRNLKDTQKSFMSGGMCMYVYV